jgi:hypothetical protein
MAVARFLLVFLLATTPTFAAEPWQSHAPQRPLPVPSNTPLGLGPHFFVDGKTGDDAATGDKTKPWRTIAHGVSKLKPGDTLVVRGGTYHEHITATLQGTAELPIVIRSAPGELAVIDGGLKDFLYDHATAWEPCPAGEGVAGEYRSTKTYSGLEQTEGDLHVSLLGNFADSMTPLHGYWNRGDLQSDNPYFNLNEAGDEEAAKPKVPPPVVMPDGGFKKGSASKDAAALVPAKANKQEVGKTGKSNHVYCGPGVWYDRTTGRIHCRLAHTKLSGLGDDNYRGETDPRKTPLVIAPFSSGSVVKLVRSEHVKLQDFVIRGARQATLHFEGGHSLKVDGCTLYGGSSPIKVEGVQWFDMDHTACRGLAAPWTFRGSLKYRSIESRLFTAGSWDPSGYDGFLYTISNCEFTDSVDGVFIGNVRHVTITDSLLENISDDGIFVTAGTGYDGQTFGGGHEFSGNRFARILTALAFGVGHGRQKIIKDAIPPAKWGDKQLGLGVSIHHNVFDFRRPVHYYWPTGPDAPQEITSLGRFAGDHGSPGWEKMDIYNNTILCGDPPRYDYGTGGIIHGMGSGTKRRVVNNIFYQIHGLPGQSLPPADVDLEARNNLFWSATDGATFSPDQWCVKFRDSADGKKRPEWTKDDKFADPLFEKISTDWREPVDLRLKKGSPAIAAGLQSDPTNTQKIVELHGLEEFSTTHPDLGAVAHGGWPDRIGCRERVDLFGNERTLGLDSLGQIDLVKGRGGYTMTTIGEAKAPPPTPKRVAIVTGYPAFDAPLVAYALRRKGALVETFEKQWLDPRSYKEYDIVVVDGSFTRAGLKTTKFADDELPIVRKFLDDGGVLWLCRDRHDIFSSDTGRTLVEELVGPQSRDNSKNFSILMPKHPWVAHLAATTAGSEVDTTFITAAGGGPGWSKGDTILGTTSGRALLGDAKVGQGRVIYLGWSPAAAIPHGRIPPKVADEARYEAQMQVITNIAADVTGRK